MAEHIRVLLTEEEIKTIGDLLKFTSQNGWSSLKRIKGMGRITYDNLVKTLYNANFIVIGEDKSIVLAPEIAALVM